MTAKVYYNSACPVCRAGIDAQRGRMEACGATDVEWIDVHQQPERAAECGADLEAVRERLRVIDETGSIGVGTEAFARLWQRTPGQGWAATIVRLPLVRPLSQLGYNIFARLLYLWNRALRHW